MDRLLELSNRVEDFVIWMEKEVVPTLKPDYQQEFFEQVKGVWEKAELLRQPGQPNLIVHHVGTRAVKQYAGIVKTLHYLENTSVPLLEIVKTKWFPKGIIEDPERMFTQASRAHMVKMFSYSKDFAELYYDVLLESDPALAKLLEMGHVPVDSKAKKVAFSPVKPE